MCNCRTSQVPCGPSGPGGCGEERCLPLRRDAPPRPSAPWTNARPQVLHRAMVRRGRHSSLGLHAVAHRGTLPHHHRLSPTAAERVPLTSREWAIGGPPANRAPVGNSTSRDGLLGRPPSSHKRRPPPAWDRPPALRTRGTQPHAAKTSRVCFTRGRWAS